MTYPIAREDLFTRTYRLEIYRVAQEAHGVPLYTRIWMLAMADANNDGHAEYGGERTILARIGPQVVLKTGEEKQWSKNALYEATRRAVDLGLLHESSDVNCLVLNGQLNGYSGPGGQGCRYHGIRAGKASDS